MSENGWTNDTLCTEWFRDSFIPAAKARNMSGKPILLIYDGHGSHTTSEMRDLAEKYDIELFQLPAHTTHRTQPLDVGVFGPLQTRWEERCDAVLHETGHEIRKTAFIKEYMVARGQAFLPETIKKAWAKCGIWPFNPNIFTDEDFAPSVSTSTKGHFPASYPPSFANSEASSEGSDHDDSDSKDDDDNEYNEFNDRDDNNDHIEDNLHTRFHARNDQNQCTSSPPPPSKRKWADLEAENVDLRRQLKEMEKQKEQAWVHATMARVQCEEMAKKLNSKAKNQDELPLMDVPEVRWLTGERGREVWRAEEAVIQAKKQKKADVVARKEQAEADKQQRRREMMLGTREVAFSGGLSSKKVDELCDIAYALALSEGKKEDLVAAIKSELAAHPEYQKNPRFSGLFPARGQQRNALANENTIPQGPAAGPSILRDRTESSDHAAMVSGPLQPPQAPTLPGNWPPQSFSTYHYSSYIANQSCNPSVNLPLQHSHFRNPLTPVHNPPIPTSPSHFYHYMPSHN